MKEKPLISEIATNYQSFIKITTNEVYVSQFNAGRCSGLAAPGTLGPNDVVGIFVYMNKDAANAFSKQTNLFPVGSVVVKRKTISGSTGTHAKLVHTGDNGVGGMVKRAPGYDPAHGDWEYFYFDDPAKIESGRIASCVQCHEAAKGKDYVFGTWKN